MVEGYFWTLGAHFEPHYSRARIYLTKVIVLLTIHDDIYDGYGTLEELRAFTEVIQRFVYPASTWKIFFFFKEKALES